MLTSYKKRFIIMTTALVGVILTAFFSLTAVYISMEKYRGLENTMRQVARPFDTQGIDSLVDRRDRFEKGNIDEKTDGSIDSYDYGERGQNELRTSNYRFSIYVFNEQTNTVSTVSESDFTVEEDVSNIIKYVSESKEDFGTLKKQGVIFFKEKNNFEDTSLKIVLTSHSFYVISVFRDVGFMFALFAFLMLFFIFLAWKMSSYAAQPMEKAMEIEKQFVANVSHDLKTPITVILANNSIIKSSPETTVAEQMQWISSTDTAARNMLEMINEMLTFSSLEAEKPNQKLKKINASSVAEKCILQFESIAYDREIYFMADVDSDIFINSTDDYTERIFNSIIENAFKYEPNGGKIEISLKKEKKKGVFCVKNYGSYISKEDLPHIFERFYRADKTRNEKKGHGLGLPIVLQITNIINAKISAESSEEQGTKFTVVFELSEK